MPTPLAGVLAELGIENDADNYGGYRPLSETDRRRYAQGITRVQRVLDAARRARDRRGLLMEAFGTPDFPLQFGWYTDLRMLAAYKLVPASWKAFLARSEVPDFRPAARDRLHGLNTPMQLVLPGAPYPQDAQLGPGSRNVDLVVNKLGREFGINWEAMINDVLRQLERIPSDLAEAAARTEMLTATQSYCAHPTIYGTHVVAGVNCTNKGTGVLSIPNLKSAITTMRKLRDEKGNPIFTGEKLTLVVPPDLEILAKELLGAQSFIFDSNPAAGSQKQRWQTDNYIAPLVNLAVDYYLPIVNRDGHGDTGWYLFADPSVFPAGEVAFLGGHTTPELFMRTPNAVSLSATGATGGMVDALAGSFETDDIRYKLRYPVGAALYEWRATYYSDGTTS